MALNEIKPTRNRVSKKKNKISRRLIPKELKDIWDKGFHDLTPQQRSKLTEAYVAALQKYEFGMKDQRPPKPAYLNEREKIKKAEQEAKEEATKKRQELKKEQLEELELKKKLERLKSIFDDWQNNSLVILSAVETIQLENAQLKIELAKKRVEDVERVLQQARDSVKLLEEGRDKLAEQLEEKYEIDMSQYNLDLTQGLLMRRPEITFPYNLENLPEDEV